MSRPWPRPQPSARTWFFTKLDTLEERVAAEDEWDERARKVEEDLEKLHSGRENFNWRSDDVRDWLIDRFAMEGINLESSSPNGTKMQNLKDACSFALQEDNLASELSWDFIARINKIVLTGLGDPEPSIRRRELAFARELNAQGNLSTVPHVYPPASRIDEAMAALLETYRERLVPGEQSLAEAICWAADFFLRFLAIHPFGNGNGRTARVLFSWLLEPFFPVPIVLFAPSQDDSLGTAQTLSETHNATLFPRRLYILSIQAARKRQNVGFFHRYALEAVLTHLRELEVLL